MQDYTKMDKDQARKSVRSLMYEAGNLSASSLLTFFEIDLSSTVKSLGSSLVDDGKEVGVEIGVPEEIDDEGNPINILRFHNNIKVFNSFVIWQGKTFFPAPIESQGFDLNSRGVLPTPILRMTSQKEEGIAALSILRRAIRKYGDLIGGKVTRIRTFAKYLDMANFSDFDEGSTTTEGTYNSPFPQNYEPDPYAELPRDVFYIERKTGENKNALEYELSALLDVEGIKIPRRRVLSQKCSFSYRGCGCFYQQKETAPFNTDTLSEDTPYDTNAQGPGTTSKLLAKCGIRDTELTLPEEAPPVATVRDEDIRKILGFGPNYVFKNKEKWKKNKKYSKGDCIYMEHNSIQYFFIASKNLPAENSTRYAPPNPDHWIADLCSKTIEGCRMRWGVNGLVKTDETPHFEKGELQFGGFPNATRLEQTIGG